MTKRKREEEAKIRAEALARAKVFVAWHGSPEDLSRAVEVYVDLIKWERV